MNKVRGNFIKLRPVTTFRRFKQFDRFSIFFFRSMAVLVFNCKTEY